MLTRHFFCFSLFLSFAFNTFAQSDLIVDCPDKHKFFLSINGIRQNVRPQENVRVGGLPAGQTKVEVNYLNDRRTPLVATIFLYPGQENLYAITGHYMGKHFLEYKGAKPLKNTRVNIDTYYDNNGQSNPNSNYTTAPDSMSAYHAVGNSQMRTLAPMQSAAMQKADITKQTNPSALPQMYPADFMTAKNDIANAKMPEQKVIIAKGYAQKMRLRSKQILLLMNMLPDEKAKLDFATAAYPTCYDPADYRKVKEGLQEDSAQALEAFLGK
jgi:Domain of unknown function (DUF4476)